MDALPDRSRLKYVSTADLDDTTIDFDHLKVRSGPGDKLGEVDGAIVDAVEARPYYVVVDAGGLLHAKRYLIPVGHLRLDHDHDALVADLTRDQISRFPPFDPDEFEKLDDEGLRRMEDRLALCCTPAPATGLGSVPSQPHYRLPEWWHSSYYPRRPQAEKRRDAPAGTDVTRPRHR